MQAETIPHIWRDLTQSFGQDATSPRVDELAADLAARVGAAGYEPCLGLVRPESVSGYYGVTYLLDTHGITLRRHAREDGKGVFIYASLKKPRPSEFLGARVFVRRHDALSAAVA